jgi:hypothetical protein
MQRAPANAAGRPMHCSATQPCSCVCARVEAACSCAPVGTPNLPVAPPHCRKRLASIGCSGCPQTPPAQPDPRPAPPPLPPKVAEQFVARRIKPALRKAREADLLDVAKETGAYLKGLWIRLNGGGNSGKVSLPVGMPLPTATGKECELGLGQLGLELESLEKKLQVGRCRGPELGPGQAPRGSRAASSHPAGLGCQSRPPPRGGTPAGGSCPARQPRRLQSPTGAVRPVQARSAEATTAQGRPEPVQRPPSPSRPLPARGGGPPDHRAAAQPAAAPHPQPARGPPRLRRRPARLGRPSCARRASRGGCSWRCR